MEELIFDRTLLDVEIALENQDATQFQKGAYNYNDLNRVESWCEYLAEKLGEYGFIQELVVKTDWSMTDYPTREEIDRIRKNIDTLKGFCYVLQTREMIYNNTLDYEQANTLEKILFDISKYLENITRKLNLDYQVATVLVTKKYISLSAEEGGEN